MLLRRWPQITFPQDGQRSIVWLKRHAWGLIALGLLGISLCLTGYINIVRDESEKSTLNIGIVSPTDLHSLPRIRLFENHVGKFFADLAMRFQQEPTIKPASLSFLVYQILNLAPIVRGKQ